MPELPPDQFFRSSKTLHRSTQELSLQMAELESALGRDESARFQQALLAQQKVRIGGILGLAVLTIFVRDGALGAIAFAAAITGSYIFVLLRVSSAALGSPLSSRGDVIPLAIADAAAVTALCAFAAAGSESEALLWILLSGGVAAPATAYAFGRQTGIVSFALFGVGYLTTDLLYLGLGITNEEPFRVIATVSLWGGAVWPFMRYLAEVRLRLDTLRTYAKLGEVGDIGTSDLISGASGSDDFALIARSLEKVHSRLSEQIGSDPLTGCANRRGLERQLLGVCRIAKRRDEVVAVAAIDIDHFKDINDTRGHPEGDRVLRQLATIMMSTARDTDTVARLGGDEFVVVLPDSDFRGARIFAERLMEKVKSTAFGPPGGSLPVTLSIGIAVGKGKEELEPDRLLVAADRALYQAKASGRNRIAAAAGSRTSIA